MATQVQSSKGQWIGISTAEETGAKFADGKGKCSWSAMLRCRQKFTKRLVGQPWRDFVKGESDFVKGIDTETEHSKQSFGRPVYKLVLPSEIQRRAADAWSDVTIGGKKFFNDGVSADSLATNHDLTPEPMVVTTTAAVESTSNATVPEDTAAEQSQPIAERLRNEREVSTAPKDTENTMPQITVSPQQRQEKVQEWREVILYDDDHRPFIITDANMRKTKSATPELERFGSLQSYQSAKTAQRC